MLDSEKIALAIDDQVEEYDICGDGAYSCITISRRSDKLKVEYFRFIKPHINPRFRTILDTDLEGAELQEFRLRLMSEFRDRLISQGR